MLYRHFRSTFPAAVILQIAFSVLPVLGQDKQDVPTDPSRFNRMPAEPFRVREDVQTVAAFDAPLENGDLVIGVVVGDEARAYPINFLIGPRNEIVNDKLGGNPLAVTWCSVNRSPCVYSRRIDEQTLAFGVRGIQDATLIMYDAQSQSFWSQVVGEALEGPLKGRALPKIPSILTTWGVWRSLHPASTVYVDWSGPYYSDFSPGTIREFASRSAGPVQPEDLVIALEADKGAKAYALKDVAGQGPVNDEVSGEPVLVFLSPDKTTVRVFARRVENQTLTFKTAAEGMLMDTETGSVWDPVSLTARSGRLTGKQLELRPAVLSLWQGWKLYRPKTVLYSPGQ